VNVTEENIVERAPLCVHWGWRLQPPAISYVRQNAKGVNLSEKEEKNRKSGAFWCILVHRNRSG